MNIRKKLYPLKTRALDILCDVSAGARSFNPEKNILIFSYPRSGSTWFMELVRNVPGTVSLWEPLHLRNVKPFRELGFGWRQHIPEHAEWKRAEEEFEKLFSGEYLNFWLSSRESPLRFITADRMIVKFVRANALMPWILSKFKFELKPLFLLRHPFAVAASQLKEGSWDSQFHQFKIPDMRYNEIFKRHESFLSTLQSMGEEMVATWCINNKIVLEKEDHGKEWIPVFYEELLINPEKKLQEIFDQWNIPLPHGIFDDLRKASSTTKEATFQKGVKKQLSKWENAFTPEEIQRMKRVLDYFEIKVYSDGLLPKSGSGLEQKPTS